MKPIPVIICLGLCLGISLTGVAFLQNEMRNARNRITNVEVRADWYRDDITALRTAHEALDLRTTQDWYSNAVDDIERSNRIEALEENAVRFGDWAAMTQLVDGSYTITRPEAVKIADEKGVAK